MTEDSRQRTRQWTQDIHQGDAREVLGEMPANSVHLVATSPPYYGLRGYTDDEREIGREETVEEYAQTIVEIAREIRRVLRDDGSLFLNLGDSYVTSAPGNPDSDRYSTLNGGTLLRAEGSVTDKTGQGIPEKSLMLAPSRVAQMMIDDGWILRNRIPWVKADGGKPEPVNDRLHKAHEYVFHFTPGKDYWYDLYGTEPDGKSQPDVWEFPPGRDADAHFAVFPPELPRKAIRLACPPKVCSECGAPYERDIVEKSLLEADPVRPQAKKAKQLAQRAGLSDEHLEACRAVGFSDAGYGQLQTGAGKNDDDVEALAAEAKEVLGGYFREFTSPTSELNGWEQTCGCDTDETKGGIVLDPFVGSGTTARVAKDLGRRWIGIELSPEYVALAQQEAGVTVDDPDQLLDENERSLSAFAGGGGRD